MIETALKLLNGTEIFKEKLPAIIEVFVEFYGEENRSYIEERLNSIIPICFNKPEEKKYIIQKAEEAIQNRLYESFFQKYNLENNYENSTFYFPYNLGVKGFSLMEKYEEYKKRTSMSQEDKYNETVASVMYELKTRCNFPHSFEYIKSKMGTPALDEFLRKVPQYMRPHLESVLVNIKDFVDIDEERMKKQVVDKLSTRYPEINMSNFDEYYQNRENNFLKDLDSMLEDFVSMRTEFTEVTKPLSKYKEYCSKCDILEEEIEEKALLKTILDMQEHFPKEEIDRLKSLIEKGKKVNLYDFPTLNQYFSSKLGFISPVACFSSENDKILRDNTEDWRINSIKYDRIRYFKNKGIDKGDNYDDYANSPECQAIAPSPLLVDKVIEAKEVAKEQAKIEFYQSLPDYKSSCDFIRQCGITEPDHGFDENTYENTLMCICPNIVSDESGVRLAPIGAFRLDINKVDALDAYIMHELNHVYELDFIKNDENVTEYRCGWDFITHPKNQTREITLKENKTKRNYELFNEIINELISQDIASLMQQHGIYLFSSEDNYRISNKTSYESTMFIIRDFYKLYHKDILESRRSGDMSKLFAKVGENNFNELNGLFAIFNEHFAGMKIYTMLRELNEGKDTERTRIYHGIIEKRDAIIARMIEQTKEYELNQGQSLS